MSASPIDLRQAYSELQLARTSVDQMGEAREFQEFEYHWKAFLTAIERVWLKAERSCQPVRATFEPWQGSYTRLRRKDPLLRYLKHARDADTHTLEEIIKQHPGEIRIEADPTGRPTTIRNFAIWQDGSGSAETSGGVPRVSIVPAHVQLVRFKESGTWYNPPTTHLEMPIADRSALTVVRLGYEFYMHYLQEIENKYRGA